MKETQPRAEKESGRKNTGKKRPETKSTVRWEPPSQLHTAESSVRDGDRPETLGTAREESNRNTVVRRQHKARAEPQTQRTKVSGEGDPGVRPEEEQTSSWDGAPRVPGKSTSSLVF